MGYNQNNAGIHLVPRGYKGSFDSFQPYDRYGAIIAENNLSRENREKKILEDIKLCNFISIADKRGQVKQCACGGKLSYKENLEIRFHKNGKMSSIHMNGKQCIDCERKLVIKGELFLKLEKNFLSKSNR